MDKDGMKICPALVLEIVIVVALFFQGLLPPKLITYSLTGFGPSHAAAEA